MKSKAMQDIDDLVENWQITNCNETFNRLFKKYEYNLKVIGKYPSDLYSEVCWVFYNSCKTWKKESNVWFQTWFSRLWRQNRWNYNKYRNSEQYKKEQQAICIDGFYDHEQKYKWSEMIATPKKEQEKYEMTEKHKIRLESYVKKKLPKQYADVFIFAWNGKTQTEIAKELGLCQSRISKIYSQIAKHQTSDDIRAMLRGDYVGKRGRKEYMEIDWEEML